MVPIQNIDKFQNVLKEKQLESLIREEVVCSKRLRIQRMDEGCFEELVGAMESSDQRKGLAKMQGVHSYDILANPIYCDRFVYTPCRYPNRSLYVISPHADKEMRKTQFDLVRLVCDLAYLPE